MLYKGSDYICDILEKRRRKIFILSKGQWQVRTEIQVSVRQRGGAGRKRVMRGWSHRFRELLGESIDDRLEDMSR